jgi:hypothetical protein
MSLLNNRRALASLGILVIGTAGVLFGVQNCGNANSLQAIEAAATGSNGGDTDVGPSGNGNVNGELDNGYVQIERLARPAVNEGLLFTNDFLNAFNSIPPTLDLATDNPAVLAVLTEASAALDLVDTLNGRDDFKEDFAHQVVAGFLPDVMRIDTSVVPGVNSIGYVSDFVLVGDEANKAIMLTGGRKIKDDVADITLTYLVGGFTDVAAVLGGAPFSIQDGVSYAGAPGNPAQGHRPLHRETASGSAVFPFLATPR